MFAFLASMDNYPISIFLTEARNKTLPIEILRYLEESPDPSIAAISSCLILLAVVVLFAAGRLVGIRRLARFVHHDITQAITRPSRRYSYGGAARLHRLRPAMAPGALARLGARCGVLRRQLRGGCGIFHGRRRRP